MLTLSVALFLMIAAVHLATGLGTPVAMHIKRRRKPEPAFMSVRSDDIYMKTDVERLLESGRGPFARLRMVLMDVVAALLVATSILEAAVIWFGLRSGELWALATLVVAGVAVIPYWALVLTLYRSRGADVKLFEVPAWMWIPTLLLLPAAIVGGIALAI